MSLFVIISDVKIRYFIFTLHHVLYIYLMCIIRYCTKPYVHSNKYTSKSLDDSIKNLRLLLAKTRSWYSLWNFEINKQKNIRLY